MNFEPFRSNNNANVGPGLAVTFGWMFLFVLVVDLAYAVIAGSFGLPMWP